MKTEAPAWTDLERSLETYYAFGLQALDALGKGDGDMALARCRDMGLAWAGMPAPSPGHFSEPLAERMNRAVQVARRLEEELRVAQIQVAGQLQQIRGAVGQDTLPEPDEAREISVEI